jgi:hypothetical protein
MAPIQNYTRDCHRRSHSRRVEHGVSFKELDLLLHFTDLDIVQPWGRMVPIRPDLEKGSKSEAEGGTGIGEKFWTWTEEQVKAYL